jgi:hypothetical protein
MSSPPRSTSGIHRRLMVRGVLVLVSAAALTGCGSSSKPAYCSDVTNFKHAAEQLKNDVTSPSGLVTQVTKVATSAETALSAVKTSFAPQTSAVKSSLAALERSVKQLSSSSTRAAAVVAIPAEVKAVATAAENLANAAASGKCS